MCYGVSINGVACIIEKKKKKKKKKTKVKKVHLPPVLAAPLGPAQVCWSSSWVKWREAELVAGVSECDFCMIQHM